MAEPRKPWSCRELPLLVVLLGTLCAQGAGQIRYSVPEELEKGALVGDIAKDLGLEPRELVERGVRIVSRGRAQLFALNARSGSLVTAGRIDREELCAQSLRCVVSFNVLVENKMKIYGVEVEIMDINDNFPRFRDEELKVKINENAAVGTRLVLPFARDADVGVNSLHSYQLSSNLHFSLDVKSGKDGQKYPELVLEQPLDREKEAAYNLLLTALDGGEPTLSSTAQIHVEILDANDNAPLFARSEYRVSVPENVPVGTQLLTLTATDPDEGINGKLTYSFRNEEDKIAETFQLDPNTGEISTVQPLDYEKTSFYRMEVVAQDGGALLASATLLVTVQDVNDNVPEVILTSLTSSVAEDCLPGTLIALFSVHDADSAENGEIECSVPSNLPFKLEKSIDNYYHLLTTRALDREEISDYNITVTVKDHGTPALSTENHIFLKVRDVNDNPPTFTHASYYTSLLENNPRGVSIFSVTAHDPDSGDNAQVTYSLAEYTFQGAPLSSYISINTDTGVLYALRSFDYEQFRDLQLWVTASDSGEPPLSSNASFTLSVLDQNDNAPEILYPTIPTDGSTGVELAPRSAEPGYLVTKVVAVDRDSGQNAWLSYRLLKASEPGLFSVGLHTGEVRTARALLDRDALKQSLVVAVQDHGQPPLSATVTLTVAVADSIPAVLADLGSLKPSVEADEADLTLYLVVAVATVSCVFLAFVIVLLALRLRRWHHSRLLQASRGRLSGMPASHFVGVDTFLQTYSHEISLTSDSRKSHLIFPQPNYADMLISEDSCEKQEPLLVSDKINPSKEEPGAIQVSFLAVGGERKFFSVSPGNGNLVVGDRIDREQICGQKATCFVEFEVVAVKPLTFFHVTVLIQYLNHMPIFSDNSTKLEISELAPAGTTFAAGKEPDGSSYPELVQMVPLDREQQARHLLVLTAMDCGTLPRSYTTPVQVIVADAHDNSPNFTLDVYSASVRENLPANSAVLPRVMATDTDEGGNAKITYPFINVGEAARQLFRLGSKTRERSMGAEMDFEERVFADLRTLILMLRRVNGVWNCPSYS
ncbi:protocadherin gamma-A5-like [Ochotona princeps]|uniref:protocadherin gamma-A5-like n=1 Tax=Ochotona princeps TaxID=9978 RepID=UPI0027145D12|nr:protocadherin gamma-A5-like [Ochotona princeps]